MRRASSSAPRAWWPRTSDCTLTAAILADGCHHCSLVGVLLTADSFSTRGLGSVSGSSSSSTLSGPEDSRGLEDSSSSYSARPRMAGATFSRRTSTVASLSQPGVPPVEATRVDAPLVDAPPVLAENPESRAGVTPNWASRSLSTSRSVGDSSSTGCNDWSSMPLPPSQGPRMDAAPGWTPAGWTPPPPSQGSLCGVTSPSTLVPSERGVHGFGLSSIGRPLRPTARFTRGNGVGCAAWRLGVT